MDTARALDQLAYYAHVLATEEVRAEHTRSNPKVTSFGIGNEVVVVRMWKSRDSNPDCDHCEVNGQQVGNRVGARKALVAVFQEYLVPHDRA